MDTNLSRPLTDSELIAQALADGKNKRVRKLLQRLHPAKVAALLERLEPPLRSALWQQVDATLEGRILAHLNPALRVQLAGESLEAAGASGSAPDAANQLDAVRRALGLGRLKRVGKILARMHPAKIAGLLEALPPTERLALWSMVETERTGKVLTYLHDEIRNALALDLDLDDLVAAAQHLELDDLVDLIQHLPGGLGGSCCRPPAAPGASSWSPCCPTPRTRPVA